MTAVCPVVATASALRELSSKSSQGRPGTAGRRSARSCSSSVSPGWWSPGLQGGRASGLESHDERLGFVASGERAEGMGQGSLC